MNSCGNLFEQSKSTSVWSLFEIWRWRQKCKKFKKPKPTMPTTPDFRQILIRKGLLMSLWLKWAKASRDYINYILGSFYSYLANICSILDNFLVKIYELLKIKIFRNPTHIIFMLPVRLSDYRAVGLSKSSSTGSGYIHEILNIYLFTSYFKTT